MGVEHNTTHEPQRGSERHTTWAAAGANDVARCTGSGSLPAILLIEAELN